MDKTLEEILACPSCKSAVKIDGEYVLCTGDGCSLKFPIKKGIPVMLIDEAEKKS